MLVKQTLAVFALVFGCISAFAQQVGQVQLKIEPSNRTLTVSAGERVTADPEIAILHIGYETTPSDAKTAYAAGAKISNEIIAALKQAGISENSIRSESQQLNSFDYRARKYKLIQHWTVKTPPERAAEILDLVIAAGATESDEIDWTVKDERALEDQALEKASARAKADAQVMARGMGVRLGALIYASNQVSATQEFTLNNRNFASLAQLSEGVLAKDRTPSPLAIEPHKVSRMATVYAVFAIE